MATVTTVACGPSSHELSVAFPAPDLGFPPDVLDDFGLFFSRRSCRWHLTLEDAPQLVATFDQWFKGI